MEISLSTIRKNYELYESRLPKDMQIMAVVTADAYGHGDREVARELQKLGCKHFAVSNIHEAFNLSDVDIAGEILILGYTPPHFLSAVYSNNITQTVLSEEYANLLLENKNRI